MIEYLVEDRKFVFSYQEMRDHYYTYCQMPDEQFMKQLPAAAHLACVICYFKEIPGYVCLADTGIIHELIHLMHIPEGNTSTLRDIRNRFEETLRLA